MSKRIEKFKAAIKGQSPGLKNKKLIKELEQAPYCQQLNRLAMIVGKSNNFLSMRYDYSSQVLPQHGDKKKKKTTKKIKAPKTDELKSGAMVSENSKTEVNNENQALSQFSLWLNQLNQKEPAMGKSSEKSKSKDKSSSKKKKNKKSVLKRKIEASLDKNQEIASEQLAELYVKQGHIKKAIKCYKQLRLNNPQKSSYFAARIEQLKKVL